MGDLLSALAELAEPPDIDDIAPWTDKSDTSQAASGTTKRNKAQWSLGHGVNAQTGTSYTFLRADFRKLVTQSNGGASACTLPQAGANFPAQWFVVFVNLGAGAATITPTTSTINGAASMVFAQGEGAIIVSDGTNYTAAKFISSATGTIGGSTGATDNALLRADGTGGATAQASALTVDDNGALTVPEIAAPGTPASGKVVIYAKADGHIYQKDDAGTETDLAAVGTGAEVGANSDITSMDGLTGALVTPTRIDFAEGAAPGTPGANKVSLYAKSDGKVYIKDDTGAETDLTDASGSIAPLTIDSANVVSQRNTTNAQTFKVYKTDDGAGNANWIQFSHTGSNQEILSSGSGSGGISNLIIRVDGGGSGAIFSTSGLEPVADRGLNFGASGKRWNQGFFFRLDMNGDGIVFTSGPTLQSGGGGWLQAWDTAGTANSARISLGDTGSNGIAFHKPANSTYGEFKTSNLGAHIYVTSAGNKYVSTQFDKTNTTLADITDLTTEVLIAGKTYGFEALLFVDADAVGGSKYAIAGTATATAIKYEIVFISDSANSMVITSRQTALGGSAGQAGTAAGICRISGTITVNAAGTLTVQFAQNAAMGTSSVLTMSNFRVWQIN